MKLIFTDIDGAQSEIAERDNVDSLKSIATNHKQENNVSEELSVWISEYTPPLRTEEKPPLTCEFENGASYKIIE